MVTERSLSNPRDVVETPSATGAERCPIEAALEELRLPPAYTPRLLALLGSPQRILSLDSARLSVAVGVIMPPEHTSRFVRHIQLLKNQSPASRAGSARRRLFLDEPAAQAAEHAEDHSVKQPAEGEGAASDLMSPVSSMTQFNDAPTRPAGPLTCIVAMLAPLRAVLDSVFPPSQQQLIDAASFSGSADKAARSSPRPASLSLAASPE